MGTEDSTVTAAELVRSFAKWRDLSRQKPVHVTNHGRETHILLGVDMYEALAGKGSSRDSAVSDEDQTINFADWIDDAVILYDEHLNITFANRVATAICRRPLQPLIGRPLTVALPEVAGTLLEVHARRTAVGSEPNGADIPSPFNAGSWLRIHSFPLSNRNVLMFRDISDEVERHRLADVKAALIETMSLHGGIGYVRLSQRGEIERVDPPFCAMLGLSEERLLGVPLADLVGRPQRADFRAAIDSVLRDGRKIKIDAPFLTNTGETAVVTAAVCPLHGAYGAEGAVLLMIVPDSK